MSVACDEAHELYLAHVGHVEGTSDWSEVTQTLIDDFARTTLDFAPIHVNPVAAARGPFGTTIAHGLLTLSMLPHLSLGSTRLLDSQVRLRGGVNYGFDKVRFVSPVKVNSRIRGVVTLTSVERTDDRLDVTRRVVVELEGSERPALVAEWIWRSFF